MNANETRTLTAFQVTYADGSSYVTSMAAGVTLRDAALYFVGQEFEQADGSVKVVASVRELGASATPTSLHQLFEAMMASDPATLDPSGEQWSSSLPVFGPAHVDDGGPIDNPAEVWSWDDRLAIVGACADDLRLVPYSLDAAGRMTLTA